MSEQLWWYATRAAGLMTWTTATASVVFGLLLSTRAVRTRTGPWFLDLHRFLGGISVVFLAAHLGTLWADSFVDFGPKEIFVPGASEWKPEAIAWGIIAAYLLVAIEVSSLLRKRINGTLWRVIHFSSFAAMIGGSYHAYLAGTDVDNPITWVIAGIGSLLVLGLISMRLQRQDPDEPGLTGMSENRAILEEMRKRLEELPIPESTPQPQISLTPNPTLPRRAPVGEALPGIEPHVPVIHSEAIDFSNDPFDAVPLTGQEPELGDWVDPSSADPFGAPVDPFHVEERPAELPSRLAVAPPPQEAEPAPLLNHAPKVDDGADLFAGFDGDPFARLGVTPPEPTEGFPELPPFRDTTDLFASVAPTPVAAAGPPPLPDATDPLTGEPDQAAYTAWLKDWLVFAERYGDEAPEDPKRF